MSRRTRIIWRVTEINPKIASVRYRVALPALHLAALGYRSQVIGKDDAFPSRAAPAAVVFSKAYSDADLRFAMEARKAGSRIILDLCDNIFVEGYSAFGISREAFRSMAGIAAAIVTTGPALADVVRREIGPQPPIHIVPDGIETPAESRRIWRNMFTDEMRARVHRSISGLARTFQQDGIAAAAKSGASLAGLAAGAAGRRARKLAGRLLSGGGSVPEPGPASASGIAPRAPAGAGDAVKPVEAQGRGDEKTLLWFGNHGSPYATSGLPDLCAIGGEIAELSRRHRLRVVVVTNSRDRYDRLIAPLAFPSQYVEWAPGVTEHYLSQSAVALIPSSLDSFSICKSANRTILALYHGVPVVATRTPALEPLASCVTFDDWIGGVERYLADKEHARNHLEEGARIITEQYAGHALAARWDGILKLSFRSPAGSR